MRNKLMFTPGEVVGPSILSSSEELDSCASLFAVHCRAAALQEIRAHSRRFYDTEVFGVLLGRVFKTPSCKVRTCIEDFFVPEELERSTIGSVEVSAEQLMIMDRIFEARFAGQGLLKVGWFHTHPGHGIFMSHTDRNNHSLYRLDWQVALVVDPRRDEVGFFAGVDCLPIRDVFYSDNALGAHAVSRHLCLHKADTPDTSRD